MFLSYDSFSDQRPDFDEKSFRKFVLSLCHSLQISLEPKSRSGLQLFNEKNDDEWEKSSMKIRDDRKFDEIEKFREQMDEFEELREPIYLDRYNQNNIEILKNEKRYLEDFDLRQERNEMRIEKNVFMQNDHFRNENNNEKPKGSLQFNEKQKSYIPFNGPVKPELFQPSHYRMLTPIQEIQRGEGENTLPYLYSPNSPLELPTKINGKVYADERPKICNKFEEVKIKFKNDKKDVEEKEETILFPAEIFEIYNKETLKLLGKGSFGCVISIQNSKNSKFYAIKILKIEGEDDEEEYINFQAITKEINILYRLRYYDNIVRFLDHYYDKTHKNYFIIMEKGTITLADMIEQNPNGLDLKLIINLFLDVLYGLHNAHNNSVAHSDIKPANIIYFEKNPRKILNNVLQINDFTTAYTKLSKLYILNRDLIEENIFKILDFGAGTMKIQNDETLLRKGMSFTPLYGCPEVILSQTSSEIFINFEKADVYGLAKSLLSCLGLKKKQITIKQQLMSNRIEHDEAIDAMLEKIDSKYDCLKETLKGMLLYDKNRRFTLKECFDNLGYDVTLSVVNLNVMKEQQYVRFGGNEENNALPPDNIAIPLGTYSEAEFELLILKIKKAKDFLRSKQAHSEELAELERNNTTSAIKEINNDYVSGGSSIKNSNSYIILVNEIKNKFEEYKNECRHIEVEVPMGPEIYKQSGNIQVNSTQSRQTEKLLVNHLERYGFSTTAAAEPRYQGQTALNSEKTVYQMKYPESGETYIGSFKKGFREGKGIIIYSDSSIYEGNFRRDQKSEIGTMLFANNTMFHGVWRNNMMEYGKFYDYEKDTLYFGNFKSDLKHGIGIEHYSDNSYFKGEFFKNKKQGKGVMKEIKMLAFDVEFEQDNLVEKNQNLNFFEKIFK